MKAVLEKNAEALNEQQTSQTVPVVSEKDIDLHGIACIGDLVMLGSAMELKKTLPDCYIDAKVSRYVGAGVEIAESMEAENRLGNVVLIALGTNGPLTVSMKQTEALLEYLGPKRHIFWVNVYCPSTG